METSVETLRVDPLFVGLTRPATMWGVPYHAFIVEFLAATLVFLGIGNPLFLLLVLPIHAALYLVSANDPGAFGAVLVWLRTSGRCRNVGFWGAASFSPLPTRKWRRQ